MGKSSGKDWAQPVRVNKQRLWAGRVGLKMHRLRIPHRSKAVVVSVREIGHGMFGLYLEGWLD